MSPAPATDHPAITGNLQAKARRLRSQADSMHPVLAESYRRRAAELDLQGWLEAVFNPPIDLRELPEPAFAATHLELV